MDLSGCDSEELRSRVNDLLKNLDLALRKAGPILEEIGRTRSEIASIAEELQKRDGKE